MTDTTSSDQGRGFPVTAMHLDTPYRHGGRLSISTGALGCRHHHTLYDNHGWTLAWHHGHPRLTPPPRDGPSP